jgi:hypothetical protein
MYDAPDFRCSRLDVAKLASSTFSAGKHENDVRVRGATSCSNLVVADPYDKSVRLMVLAELMKG